MSMHDVLSKDHRTLAVNPQGPRCRDVRIPHCITRTALSLSSLAVRNACTGSGPRLIFSTHHPVVTGHSLGGALATLAAIDVRKAIPDAAHLSISCYTFGAPRTGNHAFAREYDDLVPDTWGIINDQARNVHPVTSPGDHQIPQRVYVSPSEVRPASARGACALPADAAVQDWLHVLQLWRQWHARCALLFGAHCCSMMLIRSFAQAQDAVTRGAKFCKMYKRPGHRVIINADGDLIVRPTFIEVRISTPYCRHQSRVIFSVSLNPVILLTYRKAMIQQTDASRSTPRHAEGRSPATTPLHLDSQASVQRRPAGASVSHHLLTTYVRSYLAVIRSQFSCKGVQGGREVVAPFPAAALFLKLTGLTMRWIWVAQTQTSKLILD